MPGKKALTEALKKYQTIISKPSQFGEETDEIHSGGPVSEQSKRKKTKQSIENCGHHLSLYT